jgi:hypothetical protein
MPGYGEYKRPQDIRFEDIYGVDEKIYTALLIIVFAHYYGIPSIP